METSESVAGTPHYVLLEGNRRIGPQVLPPLSEADRAPIYGFSAKTAYDTFRIHCELALTPYPLVTVYLRGEISAAGDGPRLVVLDAAGPHEHCLHAATMEAVLEAQDNRTAHVTAAYRLLFDEAARAYRLEAAAV